MGSDLNTVMTSLRQTDEKYQDASVSTIDYVSLFEKKFSIRNCEYLFAC